MRDLKLILVTPTPNSPDASALSWGVMTMGRAWRPRSQASGLTSCGVTFFGYGSQRAHPRLPDGSINWIWYLVYDDQLSRRINKVLRYGSSGIRGDVKSTMLELLRSLITGPKGRIGVAARSAWADRSNGLSWKR